MITHKLWLYFAMLIAFSSCAQQKSYNAAQTKDAYEHLLPTRTISKTSIDGLYSNAESRKGSIQDNGKIYPYYRWVRNNKPDGTWVDEPVLDHDGSHQSVVVLNVLGDVFLLKYYDDKGLISRWGMVPKLLYDRSSALKAYQSVKVSSDLWVCKPYGKKDFWYSTKPELNKPISFYRRDDKSIAVVLGNKNYSLYRAGDYQKALSAKRQRYLNSSPSQRKRYDEIARINSLPPIGRSGGTRKTEGSSLWKDVGRAFVSATNQQYAEFQREQAAMERERAAKAEFSRRVAANMRNEQSASMSSAASQSSGNRYVDASSGEKLSQQDADEIRAAGSNSSSLRSNKGGSNEENHPSSMCFIRAAKKNQHNSRTDVGYVVAQSSSKSAHDVFVDARNQAKSKYPGYFYYQADRSPHGMNGGCYTIIKCTYDCYPADKNIQNMITVYAVGYGKDFTTSKADAIKSLKLSANYKLSRDGYSTVKNGRF